MASENPFTPSFGEIPLYMAGRQSVIDDVVRSFESARRRPELTTLFSGARGTGKTTILSLLANKAEERGWVTVGVTALPGMLDEIETETRRNASHLIEGESSLRLTGMEVAHVGSLSFEGKPQRTTWRSRMNAILDELDEHETGLLITVDEVNPSNDEMIQLATTYQHFVREGRRVSLLMAGLPHNISSLLNDKTASFLRRAQSVQLGRIPDYEVEEALLKTIRSGGRSADQKGVDYAVRIIGGFPFMLQLVGYRAWNVNENSPVITFDDFEHGAAIARKEMQERILESTYRELSNGDVAFLAAMLEDPDESSVAELAHRLGKSSSSASQQRRRLLDAGIIGERRRGIVAFEMPFFREFLQERVEAQRL